MIVVKFDFFIFINEIYVFFLIIEIKICMWICDENICVCKLNLIIFFVNFVLLKEGICLMYKVVLRDWDLV